MTTGTVAPHRSPLTPERESFWRLVHAEWTKFRTVRGWVIAVLVMIVAITAFAFIALAAAAGACDGPGSASPVACPVQPTGPGGVPVIDEFDFAHQPVTGNGTITVQVTSLTGQVASTRTSWCRAAWIRGPRPGSSSRRTPRRARRTRR